MRGFRTAVIREFKFGDKKRLSKNDVSADLLPESKFVVHGLRRNAVRCDQSFPAVGDVVTMLHERHTDELVPLVIRQTA
jgi:hypothetical protein